VIFFPEIDNLACKRRHRVTDLSSNKQIVLKSLTVFSLPGQQGTRHRDALALAGMKLNNPV
jgi:hypothetical protein